MFRKRKNTLFVLAWTVSLGCVSADGKFEAVPNLWFVELYGRPTADEGNIFSLKTEKDAFRATVAKDKIRLKERYSFDTLWNGLSIEVEDSERSKLKHIEGIKNMYPVALIPMPKADFGSGTDSNPTLITALGLTGADAAQSELGYTGAGIKVGVIDTGIDYHHPDLGGCFGPTCRVATGWDFVGDGFNANPYSTSYDPTPFPDADPHDCHGHGTHVSGIIGASGGVTGVAPGVTFASYRVFGCGGSTTSDILVAAMERAFKDGMDVLNMSLGAAFHWPQYPTAEAASRLVAKGMVVVAAIGNSGKDGLYATCAPGLGENVIGVASFDGNLEGGSLISHFSSYGPSPDLQIKPDIGAPGRDIYSTLPLERRGGGYGWSSGTSMASPHVAGAVALLLEASPKTPSRAVLGILQNSADPKLWSVDPTLGILDNVHRQGAGLVQIDKAIRATTRIVPSKIAAGEGEKGRFSQKLKLTNTGARAVIYDLSYVNALSTGGVIEPEFFYESDANVSFSTERVEVEARRSTTVKVTISPATYPTYGLYGGYIVFTPRTRGGDIYRVPFAGFVGDYQSIQVFTLLPRLAKLESCGLLRGNDCYGGAFYSHFDTGTTYSMTDAYNIPVLVVHLEHHVRELRMEVFDAVTGEEWHQSSNQTYVGRNFDSYAASNFPWDGTTFADGKKLTVPDGRYVVVISVLKAGGAAENPAHWETWTSPTITIDRS